MSHHHAAKLAQLHLKKTTPILEGIGLAQRSLRKVAGLNYNAIFPLYSVPFFAPNTQDGNSCLGQYHQLLTHACPLLSNSQFDIPDMKTNVIGEITIVLWFEQRDNFEYNQMKQQGSSF